VLCQDPASSRCGKRRGSSKCGARDAPWPRGWCRDASWRLCPKGKRRRQAGWPHAGRTAPHQDPPRRTAPAPCWPGFPPLIFTNINRAKKKKEKPRGGNSPSPAALSTHFLCQAAGKGSGGWQGRLHAESQSCSSRSCFQQGDHTLHEAHQLPGATSTPFTISDWVCSGNSQAGPSSKDAGL